MKGLYKRTFTLDSASWVAVEIDEEVIAFLFLFFRVAAAFQSQIATIFNAEVFAEDLMPVDNSTIGS